MARCHKTKWTMHYWILKEEKNRLPYIIYDWKTVRNTTWLRFQPKYFEKCLCAAGAPLWYLSSAGCCCCCCCFCCLICRWPELMTSAPHLDLVPMSLGPLDSWRDTLTDANSLIAADTEPLHNEMTRLLQRLINRAVFSFWLPAINYQFPPPFSSISLSLSLSLRVQVTIWSRSEVAGSSIVAERCVEKLIRCFAAGA